MKNLHNMHPDKFQLVKKLRNLDHLLGNPCVAEPVDKSIPVEEVGEQESSLEIVDEEVPPDFKTAKDHSPWETMTRRPDGFLDGFLDNTEVEDEDHSQLDSFRIVYEEVPADLNIWTGPSWLERTIPRID